MKEIIEILKNYKLVKREFFLIIITWIIMESFYMAIPQFMKNIILIIEERWSFSKLIEVNIYMLIIVSIALFVYFLWERYMARLWFKMQVLKNNEYRWRLFDINYKDIVDVGTWKLITRLWDWVSAEVDIFYEFMNIVISSIFRWSLVLIILYFYVPNLIFVLLFWIVVLFVINYFLRKYIKKYNNLEQDCWEKDGRLKARLIMENLSIRIFWKQDLELWKSNNNLSKIPEYWLKVDTANLIYYKFLEFLLRVFEFLVYIFIWYLIITEGNLTIAYLVMVTTYIWFLWWPIDKTVISINKINKVWEKYMKLKKFLEKKQDIKNGSKKYVYKYWEIEFKDLDFSYWLNKDIFNKFNLKIFPWKKNALIWHSGWGKSTIVKIILRLYDYKSWKILVDGQDLKKLKIGTLYKHIWYLPQEPAIFDWTIRENLEYALHDRKKYKDDIMWKALKDAQIDSMIKNLEQGLDTEVWEKWIKLSWWEKQRLAIARIFLKNPEIIILDEPTSALDSISEAKITKTLNKLMKSKTSIIIAHRLQTVISADNIVIIEKWKIHSEGTHEDLILSSSIYKKLIDLQNWSLIE